MRLISEKKVTAIKEHNCDAYQWFVESDGWDVVVDDPQSYKIAVDMRDKKGKIQKGEVYILQSIEHDREIQTSRLNQEMHEVNILNDLYRIE